MGQRKAAYGTRKGLQLNQQRCPVSAPSPFTDLVLLGYHLDAGIHLLHRSRGDNTLGLPNVLRAEQKLPVQIRLFNDIIVGDGDATALPAGHSQSAVNRELVVSR